MIIKSEMRYTNSSWRKQEEVAPLMILSVKLVGLSNVILYLFGIKH